MPVSKEELARRLKAARESSNLTQADVATELNIPRSAVTELESGRRAVSGLELERIAFLLGRDMRDFLSGEFREEDVLHALFRAEPNAVERGAALPQLRHCLSLARELQNLERLADLERPVLLGTRYAAVTPRNRWEAIQQGEKAADSERQRLGLGRAPVGDIVQLLDSQGIRTALVEFPDDISGLTIAADAGSAFVAVNKTHHRNRQRFSFAHEYCHVVIDRDTHGRVSRGKERDDLAEVRANAFAATFLMPEAGVLSAVEQLGKGRPSRQAAAVFDVFDEDQPLAVESRAEPGSQEIQYYDVLQLASIFVVSPAAMIFRLRNYKLITAKEVDRLKEQDDERRAKDLKRLLRIPSAPQQFDDCDEPHAVFTRRFIGLGLEVFRRGKITLSKLKEIARLVDVTPTDLESLLLKTGLLEAAETHSA